MHDTQTFTLPVLPLTSGVVGPTMVVNIVLETPEARTAVEAAQRRSGRLLLVPKLDGHFARVGTIAKIEDVGELPGGHRAVVVRGLERAVIGAGVGDEGDGLWVSVEPVGESAEGTAVSERSRELAREYRAVVEAILEVLDPAQNHTFRDHYLEVDLDLSDVVFIATANVLETIPGPLLDRMEVVRLDGYTDEEKVAIARDHLLPRLLERSGLRLDEVEVSDDAVAEVVSGYTREAGVRELERQLGRVLRKVATRVAGASTGLHTATVVDDGDGGQPQAVEMEAPKAEPVVIDPEGLRPLLGRRRFYSEVAERTSTPGVATGLAVTGAGGEVLFVEATSMPGEAGLSLTGQLGDVMKESAEIARSFVRSHAAELGIDDAAFEGRRFHLHVPAGAVPKDGPSAGVALTTALVSLLTGRPVRHVVGMTGEVTLQGKVLAIGGVKQKVLAAHRAGLTEVCLPARNEADLDDVPEAVREAMVITFASDVREVLARALEPASSAPSAATPEATAA